MAFKQVADLDCNTTIAIGKTDKKTGKAYPKSLTGYFLGTRDVESEMGESKLHVFQTDKGNVGVWGTKDLNNKLKAVLPGYKTRVTFTGTVPTKFKPMFKYNVEVDSDDSIVVGDLHNQDLKSDEDDSSDYSSDQAYVDDSEAEEEPDLEAEEHAPDEAEYTTPARPRTKAATPSPEQQAKVKEMLRPRK